MIDLSIRNIGVLKTSPQPLTLQGLSQTLQGLSQTLIEPAQKPLKVCISQGAIIYFSQHTPFFQTLIPVD